MEAQIFTVDVAVHVCDRLCKPDVVPKAISDGSYLPVSITQSPMTQSLQVRHTQGYSSLVDFS